MAAASLNNELRERHCQPCEGAAPPLPYEEARKYLAALDGWEISDGGTSIRREWDTQNFVAAMNFLTQVGEIAEQEQHHPDLHLTGYRHVAIELTTHAIGGLSENDFILAARIDAAPVQVKRGEG
jgi:4a-hydroxytetrahydrobiopterin dehydratase